MTGQNRIPDGNRRDSGLSATDMGHGSYWCGDIGEAICLI